MSNYSYQQPPPPQYAPPKPNSTMAIISLIAGICGWTILPTIGSLVAIITGHMAKSEIKSSGGALGGDGMATAGLVLGYAAIGIAICAVCVFVVLPLLGLSMFGITNSGGY